MSFFFYNNLYVHLPSFAQRHLFVRACMKRQSLRAWNLADYANVDICDELFACHQYWFANDYL